MADPGAASDRWEVVTHRGSAGALHGLPVPSGRTVMVLEVDRPALVLGSTQDAAEIDAALLARTGVDLVRRRSGGGAVLLVPGEHVWVDLVLPAGDPLWSDDVVESFRWLGAVWSEVLAAVLGPGVPVEVHRSGVSDRLLGARVCFAASGPGEVSVRGRKLVGISQRRTRSTARFQCVVHRWFRPDRTLAALEPAARTPELRSVLERRVVDLDTLGVPAGWDVVEDLVRHLP